MVDIEQDINEWCRAMAYVDERFKSNGSPGLLDTEVEPTTTGETTDCTDALVRGIASVLSDAECAQSERKNPQPEITETDPVKARIIRMLTENTGCDILDSGGAYGRAWERNRHIPMDEWDKRDACHVTVYGHGRDGEVTISYDVYRYLTLFLDITDESERLNAILKNIVETSGNRSYLQDMEEFLERDEVDIDGYACGGIVNTYNYDNIISQVLQYGIFEVDGEPYIILQIHGGCDVRGGYTVPQIFSLNHPDYFSMAQTDITAVCGCGMWSSDDAGYSWYFDGCAPSKPIDWWYDQDNNRVMCMDCRKEVTFGVTESV